LSFYTDSTAEKVEIYRLGRNKGILTTGEFYLFTFLAVSHLTSEVVAPIESFDRTLRSLSPEVADAYDNHLDEMFELMRVAYERHFGKPWRVYEEFLEDRLIESESVVGRVA
jgi:hypothetical protein